MTTFLRTTTHHDWPIFISFVMVVCMLMASAGNFAMAFDLTSPAFTDGGLIPRPQTCDGADRSPPLTWHDPPASTRSFALIADDPDAPGNTWVHWMLYDLSAEARELPEGVPTSDTLPSAAKQGLNDFHQSGYGGPCPPRGPAHRYVFSLYALDRATNLSPRATKPQLLEAMQGHILAVVQLMGRYQR